MNVSRLGRLIGHTQPARPAARTAQRVHVRVTARTRTAPTRSPWTSTLRDDPPPERWNCAELGHRAGPAGGCIYCPTPAEV